MKVECFLPSFILIIIISELACTVDSGLPMGQSLTGDLRGQRYVAETHQKAWVLHSSPKMTSPPAVVASPHSLKRHHRRSLVHTQVHSLEHPGHTETPVHAAQGRKQVADTEYWSLELPKIIISWSHGGMGELQMLGITI